MAITTRSAAQTERLSRQLGALLQAGDVVFLTGGLGAGKTTFAKGVAQGLCIKQDVTSPTFTLVAEYEGRVPFAHMDLYRLMEDEGDGEPASLHVDFTSIGVEDYLYGDYAVLVEWPGSLIDEVEDALHIDIAQLPMPRIDEREFRCKATGERSWKLLDEWVKLWLF